MSFEYECAITGLTAPGAEAEADDKDGLEDLPVGWTKIRFMRRQYNPKWITLQQLKARLVEGLIMQHTQGHPENATDETKVMVSLQIEATFHSLEKDTPMYLNDVDDSVFISDSGEVVEAINEIREMVSLPKIEDFDEPEGDHDEDEK